MKNIKNKIESIVKDKLKMTPFKVGLLFIAFSVSALYWHYLQPQDSKTDVIAMFERKLLDLRFANRGPIPTSGKIGVLAVDEPSIARFGRWPFPRKVYENAFLNLKKQGVKWVGFDGVFSEAERTYLDESAENVSIAIQKSLTKKGFDEEKFNALMGGFLEESPGDAAFAKVLKQFGNVVQGYFYNESPPIGVDRDWKTSSQIIGASSLDFVEFPPKKTLKDYPEILGFGAFTNIETISKSTSFQGFFNNKTDPDGIVRWGTLVRAITALDAQSHPTGEPQLLPSLSLQLAARYLRREPIVSFDENGIFSIKLADPAGQAEPLSIPIGLNGDGRFLIQHYGPQSTFPHISLVDAYDNKFSVPPPEILIFGATATAINDIRPSPFDSLFPGVEHHTAILENILSENFLKRPPEARFIEIAMLVLSGIFICFLLQNTSSLQSAIVLVVFGLGYYYTDKYFIFGAGKWLYLGAIYVQSTGIYFGVTLFKYFTEEKEKKKIKNAFQHYLNPSVINQIMDHPEQLKLGGQKKVLTVFFSDVRGFTTISETLSPEALSHLLNEYFTPMTDLILKSEGLLDKYMGDAIMAVWGAPMPLLDHADRAVKSSLLMLDALDVLRKKWRSEGLPLIDIGIGLNTGPMTVGNMGSVQRFDYTVMGDAVNLGSRLEGINKQYGTRIICSEFTKAALIRPQDFILRELDDIQVKGKTEPIKIFEVLRVEQHKVKHYQELSEIFHEALLLYRKQNWAGATLRFMDCLKLFPEDGPTLEFLDRCQYLGQHNPGEDWNGVWVMKTK